MVVIKQQIVLAPVLVNVCEQIGPVVKVPIGIVQEQILWFLKLKFIHVKLWELEMH